MKMQNFTMTTRRNMRLQRAFTVTVALCFFTILLQADLSSAFAFGNRPLHRLPSSLYSSTLDQPTTPKNLLEPSAVSQRVFATDKRPVILFDGVCNLCNSAVNLALDWDPKGRLRFAALQSDVGRALLCANGREADDVSSIVLVAEDGAFIKSDAILRITEALTPKYLPLGPAAVAGRFLVPQFLRDLIYDGVANNRYQILGKRDQCRFDADGEFDDRFIDEVLALE